MNDLNPTSGGLAVNRLEHQQDGGSEGFEGLSFHATSLSRGVGQTLSDTAQIYGKLFTGLLLVAVLLAGCRERPPNQVVFINIPVQQVGTNRFVFEMVEMPNGQWIGYIDGIAIGTNDPLPLKPMRYDIETVKKGARKILKERKPEAWMDWTPGIVMTNRTTNAQFWNHQGNQITEEEWQRIYDYYGATKP